MKLTRPSTLFIACFLVIFSNWLTAKTIDVELLLDKNFKPYMYVENGKVKGIYVDLIKEASAIMPNFNVKLTPVNWTDGQEMVKVGNVLGLVGAFFHGHDWPYMYPYSLPIGHETVITICHQQVLEQKREKWPEDYKGLLVANVEGYDGWLNHQVRSDENTKYVNFLEVPAIDVAYQMVSRKNVDCALFESTAFAFVVDQNQNSKDQQSNNQPVIGTQISVNPVHVGYSRKAIIENKFPYALEFQQAFDVAIFQLERSGKADLIRKNYQP
jgi:polar amino acid transport system substrate-binding protein